MNDMEREAIEILEFAKSIFLNVEESTPKDIRCGYYWIFGDYADKYHFKEENISGVICRREMDYFEKKYKESQIGDYSVCSDAEYIDEYGERLGFAKVMVCIRDDKVVIRGRRTGACTTDHFDDDDVDLLETSEPLLPIVLYTIKNGLQEILDKRQNKSNDKFMVKTKKY